jgi:hypothetical protein
MITIKRNPIDEAVNEAKTSLIEYGELFISHETKTKVSNSVLKVKAAYANSYVYLTIMVSDFAENNVLFAMSKRYTYKQFTNVNINNTVWNNLIKFLKEEGKLSGDSVELLSITTPKSGVTLGYAFTW